MKNFLLLIFMLFFGLTQAQNILFNAEGGSPDPSAFLEVRSTTQGFLGPRMNESQRLGIVNPAQGLLVFQIDGTIGFYFYNGSAWDTLGGATTVTNVSNVTNVTNSGIAIIRDIKSGGSNGGTFTSGVWVQRDLNDIDGDLSFVSLGTNEFKLDSGTYAITIYTPAYEVKTHQCRLYNVTTAAVEAYGNVAYADKFSQSLLTTIVSVTNSSETFRIEHRCSDTVGGKGLGEGVNWGDNTFTQVKIEKL